MRNYLGIALLVWTSIALASCEPSHDYTESAACEGYDVAVCTNLINANRNADTDTNVPLSTAGEYCARAYGYYKAGDSLHGAEDAARSAQLGMDCHQASSRLTQSADANPARVSATCENNCYMQWNQCTDAANKNVVPDLVANMAVGQWGLRHGYNTDGGQAAVSELGSNNAAALAQCKTAQDACVSACHP